MCLFISGTVPVKCTVGEPGFGESLIPVWGSGRAAVNHFQNGNYWRGTGYTVLAITDVFLIKSLVTGGGKLLVKRGTTLLGKESEEILAKISADNLRRTTSISTREADSLFVKVSSAEFRNLGAKIEPGVQIAQVDGWFVKRVNTGANWFRRQWGALSIEAQEKALVRLGSDLAPEFFIKDRMLFVRSVGTTRPPVLSGTFWGAFFKGSFRMGSFLNDIRPRNMGLNGVIFDPALDPLMKSIFYTGIYGTATPTRIILRSD